MSLSAIVTSDVLKGNSISFSTKFTSTVNIIGEIAFTYLISELLTQKTVDQKTVKLPNIKANESVTVPFTFLTTKFLNDGLYYVSISVNTADITWKQLLSVPKAYFFTIRSSTPVPVPTSKLLFADDFNSLDLANPNGFWRPNDFWQNIAMGYQDFAGSSWNISPNSPAFANYSPFSINNSILTIKAFRTPPELVTPIQTEMAAQGIPGKAPAWCGGMLVQNPAVKKWIYGYFEIKARFPVAGKGMFPALWLYGTDGSVDPFNKGGAEIDLFEHFGQNNNWQTTIHMNDNNLVGTSQTVGTSSLDTSQWHTYGLDWQPTYLRFYCDNILLYEVTGTNALWFNNAKLGFRLNYAMDAFWFYTYGLNSDSTTPNVLTMEIDYVKVWRMM